MSFLAAPHPGSWEDPCAHVALADVGPRLLALSPRGLGAGPRLRSPSPVVIWWELGSALGTAAGAWAGTVPVLVTLKTKGSQGLPARCSAPSTISNVAKSGPPWAPWRLRKWLRGVLGGGRQHAWLPPVAQDSCFCPWTQLLPPALNLSLKPVSRKGYRAAPRSLSRGPGRPSSAGCGPVTQTRLSSLRPRPCPLNGRGGECSQGWSCPELAGAMRPEGGAARWRSHGVPGSRLGLERKRAAGQATCLLVPADVHCGGP